MKQTIFPFLCIFICLVCLAITSEDNEKDIISVTNTINSMQIQIDSMQIQIDSLTIHYKQCSFIERDDVAIGYKGTFYSKYYKDNKNE